MAYLILRKENLDYPLYKIAFNEESLNNLNIIKEDYIIKGITNEEFEFLQLNVKTVKSYINSNIEYENIFISFKEIKDLNFHIKQEIKCIKNFLDNNPNHIHFQKWNDYVDQLKNFDTSTISYPLEKSLEQYFKEQNKFLLNTLQLP